MEEMRLKEENTAINSTKMQPMMKNAREENHVSQLYAIMEAVADRAEMHAIIGEQRNNWNHLFLHSINFITLTASIMAGISSIPAAQAAAPHLLAFKLSSALLFTAATGMMLVVNRIQPSQLAEEQRNATRLFRQLEKSIRTALALRTPTKLDVEEAMARVLALDKAYPLPLLPGMLDKFPKTVKPAVWWPELDHSHLQRTRRAEGDGWSKELEEEMKGILGVLKRKDEEEYVRWDKLVLKINRILAVSGPLLAGLAAVGAGLIGIPALGLWPALVGVVGGALAATMNTLEHGAQVGMVFELLRNCAGFYLQLEEAIESNLGEKEVKNRENGEMLELKMALQLGRSVSELKSFASYASSSSKNGEAPEFAGKLF
ncbi:probable F-box protein At4g22030 [Elaeis guineensis]|uniref:Probable F-box protein At4g22030 n=1 Tax=Elaeis guineensis var. tenera TaxID=51953 RepID=A0A6I9R0T1_ELAGV|nr:probable F-box protein At4g22030 [Elaeis guineensis]